MYIINLIAFWDYFFINWKHQVLAEFILFLLRRGKKNNMRNPSHPHPPLLLSPPPTSVFPSAFRLFFSSSSTSSISSISSFSPPRFLSLFLSPPLPLPHPAFVSYLPLPHCTCVRLAPPDKELHSSWRSFPRCHFILGGKKQKPLFSLIFCHPSSLQQYPTYSATP